MMAHGVPPVSRRQDGVAFTRTEERDRMRFDHARLGRAGREALLDARPRAAVVVSSKGTDLGPEKMVSARVVIELRPVSWTTFDGVLLRRVP
jgi:hypothetical protein